MKHQYFGDVNDYRKYGLLRALSVHGALRLGVCWMLTPDDGRSDGAFTSYLNAPAAWRHHDPSLFDSLRSAVPEGRHLRHFADNDIVPGAVTFDALVPDGREARQEYFTAGHARLRDAELVFFDPDNGLEVASRPSGRKNSSKFALRAELAATHRAGYSVLLYQHFPREQRDSFMARMGDTLGRLVGIPEVRLFSSAHVVFILLPQPEHLTQIRAAEAHVRQAWSGQMHVSLHNVA